ncbi:hypothetical protein Tco_0137336 [Tanacetum coccineum]
MRLEEEAYKMACSNVLATDPLPNVSQVYYIMMRVEQLRNISRDRDVRSDVIAFVARQNSKRGYTSDKEKELCRHCGKLRHETNDCFDIIGYLIRSGYHQKDRKPSQNDKTEHGMEKTVKNQGQSPKMTKSESILKNQQSNRSRN